VPDTLLADYMPGNDYCRCFSGVILGIATGDKGVASTTEQGGPGRF
jgi:hypothetical protein